MQIKRNRVGHQKVSAEGKQANSMRSAYISHSTNHETKSDKEVDLLPADKRKS